MISTLDLERLANRIERLMRQSTHDWAGGDANQLRSALPDSRVRDPRRKLPDPKTIRDAVAAMRRGSEERFDPQVYRDSIQLCLRLENLVHRNRPGSHQRMMRDIRRGRLPGMR